jgi:hypothetical protein
VYFFFYRVVGASMGPVYLLRILLHLLLLPIVTGLSLAP